MNAISKVGLIDLLFGKSNRRSRRGVGVVRRARGADWPHLSAVRETFPDADLVNEPLVFNIRQNRYRLIVYPVFSRRRLYIKALLAHLEYGRKDWENKWP